jgi:branched-chain amino acid transport system ATP-binding protein
MPLLEVRNLTVRYDKAVLLSGVTLDVGDGELVGLVGPNGAGKSTMLRAIDALPAHEIRLRGLVLCPERRRPFRELTVEDNLRAGGYLSSDKGELDENLERAFTLFSRLRDRRGQIAGTLSGGEQQMLAIARALMFRAKLLCIDEPSLGLAPKIRQEVFAAIQAVHASGIPVLLIEQEVGKVFAIAGRNYVLSQGRIVANGSGRQLMADETLRAGYLGL